MGFSGHLQHRVLAFGQYNFLGARLPVPSSLNLPLWRSKLRGYDDYAACDFLEFGWPVGLNYASSLSTDQFSRNHKGATDFPSAVDSYLSLELERGAVIGPFSSNPFFASDRDFAVKFCSETTVFRAADDLESQSINRSI